MTEDDAEKRIAELERQLAEVKAALREHHPAEPPPQSTDAQSGVEVGAGERARRHAEALWEGLRTGSPSGPDAPFGPEIAQLREAFMRAAAEAGMSQTQINDVLQNGRVTIKTGHSVVYSGQGGQQRFGATTDGGSPSGYRQTFGQQDRVGSRRPRSRFTGADRFGAVVGIIGGALGLCVGGAAALTAIFPSTALWMSDVVCRSPYQLVANTSSYSYKPGQSGTSVNYRCISAAGWYDVNAFVIIGLQSLLAAIILCGVVVVVRQIRRRMQTR
ncbi:hypothetical protein [Mycobacterium sp. 852002-51163_SCH5372311]|uniref:hypothetical protein n=1 Tax=Mycobacterium sp. 852002-51163_SCH5372311 TaxID=1834097 RepID=UPI0012E7306A|nr:hypothetical protein [Mycobacterium sp. 852002-51163_SCH5372311]